MKSEGSMTEHRIDKRRDRRPGLSSIFAGFFWLGVTSFGGNTAAGLYHLIVRRRAWATDAEFLSGVALGRTMPGSGGVNLTVLIGQRLGGSSGALVAVVALLVGPLDIVLALVIVYARMGWAPGPHAVSYGSAAAPRGLPFATGLTWLQWRRAEIGPL